MSIPRPNDPEPQVGNGPTTDELLRAIIESAVDFAIFAIDPVGKVVSWNAGAERLTGYSYDDIVGRSADIIFTPEDRAAGAAERERCDARDLGRSEDERWHERKDGSRFWGSGLMMPLWGATEGFRKILRDRTETHRVQEALRASQIRFRMLATSIPQLVFRSRGTGERTWGSPQWESFTGLSDLRSREYGWLDGLHPDDRDLTVAAWGDAQRTGEYHVEHRIKRVTDGEYRWHQTRASRVQQEGDDIEEWVGTSTDIHDLRVLHDRARAARGAAASHTQPPRHDPSDGASDRAPQRLLAGVSARV